MLPTNSLPFTPYLSDSSRPARISILLVIRRLYLNIKLNLHRIGTDQNFLLPDYFEPPEQGPDIYLSSATPAQKVSLQAQLRNLTM